jgi:hypothetical protein
MTSSQAATPRDGSPDVFNQHIIEAADRVAKAAREDFFAIKRQGAVTLSAIAGAGKSTFVTQTVKECRSKGIRVAVAAPTNEQVFSLVRSIADIEPSQPVGYVAANDVELPTWAQRRNIRRFSPAYEASSQQVIVGTIHKLASALHPQRRSVRALGTFDALIVDESYQANSASYFALANIAPRHLCVGDSGQIHPFTTVEAGRQWRGLAEDPLQTAIEVLHANHPTTPRHRFPITRRLDGHAVAVAKHFYPEDHHFGAAVADGVRAMKLGRAASVRGRERTLDETLQVAATNGWAYLEQPAVQTLVADPETAQLIVDLVARLLHRGARLRCERNTRGIALQASQIAIAVTHNDQKAMVRTLLDSHNLNSVVVNTANKLQGLEFEFVICWHPLAGLDEPDDFHLEAGRLCVMCTRHRHACVVVGRRGDRELVEGVPPATPGYPGAGSEADDLLRGWEVHRKVFEALSPFLVTVT